jgi:hypothetical protein
MPVNFLITSFYGTTYIEAIADFISYKFSLTGITISTVPVICHLNSSRLLDYRGGHKTTLILKNGVFWDVMPCASCKN